MPSLPVLNPAEASARPTPSARVRSAAPEAAPGFAVQLSRVRVAVPDQGSAVVAQAGDHLTRLVRNRWAAMGGAPEALSAGQAHRWALDVARTNGLSDPDRIQAGQTIVVSAPPASVMAGRSLAPGAGEVGAVGEGVSSTANAMTASTAVALARAPHALAHPVMSQTLDRAVERGFIPAAQRDEVRQRIDDLSAKHGFRPDDFAKMALMESDGLNPRASNGRCHGIIQFCDGPDRGAASAGYGQRPQAILKLSVLEQLDLVDRYFDDTRLREFRGQDGWVRLDDLYLTVLTPAARQERRLAAPLPIAGTQAVDLYVGRDRQAAITRASILSGLNTHARQRLGQFWLSSADGR